MMKAEIIQDFTGYPDGKKAVAYRSGAVVELPAKFVTESRLVEKGLVAVKASKEAEPE
jgi:hypothetical protein